MTYVRKTRHQFDIGLIFMGYSTRTQKQIKRKIFCSTNYRVELNKHTRTRK